MTLLLQPQKQVQNNNKLLWINLDRKNILQNKRKLQYNLKITINRVSGLEAGSLVSRRRLGKHRWN